MHPNEQLIRRFYEAFNTRDAAAMNACYASDVVFRDPAFGVLESEKVYAMWEMLTSRAKDLEVTVSNIHANDEAGIAQWEAEYSFGPDRRPVHNVIHASFVFREGKISRHTDQFDMWKWTRMAIGGIGGLFGWSPLVKAAVQKSTRRQLEDYMQKRSA